jgi:hypothetical protein
MILRTLFCTALFGLTSSGLCFGASQPDLSSDASSISTAESDQPQASEACQKFLASAIHHIGVIHSKSASRLAEMLGAAKRGVPMKKIDDETAKAIKLLHDYFVDHVGAQEDDLLLAAQKQALENLKIEVKRLRALSPLPEAELQTAQKKLQELREQTADQLFLNLLTQLNAAEAYQAGRASIEKKQRQEEEKAKRLAQIRAEEATELFVFFNNYVASSRMPVERRRLIDQFRGAVGMTPSLAGQMILDPQFALGVYRMGAAAYRKGFSDSILSDVLMRWLGGSIERGHRNLQATGEKTNALIQFYLKPEAAHLFWFQVQLPASKNAVLQGLKNKMHSHEAPKLTRAEKKLLKSLYHSLEEFQKSQQRSQYRFPIRFTMPMYQDTAIVLAQWFWSQNQKVNVDTASYLGETYGARGLFNRGRQMRQWFGRWLVKPTVIASILLGAGYWGAQEGLHFANSQGYSVPNRTEIQETVTALSDWTYHLYGQEVETRVIRPGLERLSPARDWTEEKWQEGAGWIREQVGR